MALADGIRFDPDVARRYRDAGFWADDTLDHWLTRQATRSGAAPAIVTGDTTTTYAEFGKAVARVASGLHRLGIRAGDVVTVQLPNIPEFLIAFLAICRLGAIMSTAHMPYRAAELRVLLAHSGARAFIGLTQAKDASPAGIVTALRGDLPRLAHVIGVGPPQDGALPWTDLLAETSQLPDGIAPSASDPFMLLFTSGTSAAPKAVPLTYEATLGNARLGAPEHAITARDRILSAAPFTHLFGLYSFHLALWAGAANTLMPAFSPPAMAAAINALRPTMLFTAPAHLSAMLATGDLDRTDLTSLRLVIMSGSACAPELARTIAKRLPNGAFTQLWGMTETQAGLYTRPRDSIDTSATSAGRPSPGTEVRIANGQDQPVADGETGELQVRGSLMFPGYFGNDEANRDAFTPDGWFRSGDLAVRDAAGNVRITGRLKELINRGGVKYNPRDVEDLLGQHPKVAQVAIVPMPDAVVGEKACCFVVPKGEATPQLDELCRYLIDSGIAKHKLPERLVVIAEMPLTPTRKIIKGKLKDML